MARVPFDSSTDYYQLLGVGPVGGAAGALQRDVDAMLLVRELARVALGADGNAAAVDDHRLLDDVR